MKRLFVLFVCACLLLSGCHTESPSPTQLPTAATEAPAPTEEHRTPLLAQGQPIGEDGNLLYIPNSSVEGMSFPNMWLFENGLLLSENIADAFQSRLCLKYISLEDGSLLAEASLPASGLVTLRVGRDGIGLSDSAAGQVTILDAKLDVQKTYNFPQEGDAWYLDPAFSTLYVFYFDRGLLARDLETGVETWLVDQSIYVWPWYSETDSVIFEYTDRDRQLSYLRCLELSTGVVEALPVKGQLGTGVRSGNAWLLSRTDAADLFTLVTEEAVGTFTKADSLVKLLAPKNHLLAADSDCQNLCLYTTDGRFVSKCSLSNDTYASYGTLFVWSEYWGGYFFVGTADKSSRLIFWNPYVETAGQDLEIQPIVQPEQPAPLMDQAFYDRAEAISQRFGVSVCIAEQCATDYTNYTASILSDPDFLWAALDVLEESLSVYPEGFFRQLRCGFFDEIRIELVGCLTAKEGSDHPPSAAGITHTADGRYLMVLDGYTLYQDTIFHEFSHIIDRRLEWDALLRTDALYSEETWLSLQPEGFAYAMSYAETPEEILSFIDSGFFISDYALTYPTEDRATLLAAAMCNEIYEFESYPGRKAKMQYYADCIRDCFDTEGWPEVTAWEQPLQS